MMRQKREFEIIVNSCDAYEDVWLPFFSALRGNWSGEVPPIVLNTESKDYSFEGLRIRRPPKIGRNTNGVDDWGARLLSTLSIISTQYVLMLFDDYIVEEPVDLEELAICLENLDSDETIGVFYLVNPFLSLNLDDSGSRFGEVLPGSDYILNSAPGIWRKSDLCQFVHSGDNPWAWEYFGSSRFHKSGKRAFAPRQGNIPVYPYQHALGGAIYRGKWVESVIGPAVKKYGLSLDLSIRGTIEPKPIPHSLGWRFRFLFAGIRMVGFSAILLTMRAIARKLVRVAFR